MSILLSRELVTSVEFSILMKAIRDTTSLLIFAHLCYDLRTRGDRAGSLQGSVGGTSALFLMQVFVEVPTSFRLLPANHSVVRKMASINLI